jgi:hypothetical protein
MVNICEDDLKPLAAKGSVICQGERTYQEGRRASIWYPLAEICSCPVPSYDLIEHQMWEVMNYCVILHNIIIENGRKHPVPEVELLQSYYR